MRFANCLFSWHYTSTPTWISVSRHSLCLYEGAAYEMTEKELFLYSDNWIHDIIL